MRALHSLSGKPAVATPLFRIVNDSAARRNPASFSAQRASEDWQLSEYSRPLRAAYTAGEVQSRVPRAGREGWASRSEHPYEPMLPLRISIPASRQNFCGPQRSSSSLLPLAASVAGRGAGELWRSPLHAWRAP